MLRQLRILPRIFLIFGLLNFPSNLFATTETFTNDFESIQTIFVDHCISCHGSEKQRGGLRLDHKTDAFRGGDSGKVLIPGKPDQSLIMTRITSQDPADQMPPKGKRLPPDKIQAIRSWLERGANWPENTKTGKESTWWAFEPLKAPRVPSVPEAWKSSVQNPIDSFVLAKLSEKGLHPSPEADRRTLIRRLSFDLLGLPPTLEETEAFIHDKSPKAYENLVDRFLDNPHYGERWARHWLDVVHYGDTHGYDKDQPRPNAWPYRDYLIRAFNSDKPYHRFVQEQIAGDVLFPGTTDGITALGFIAAGPWDFIGHAEVPETKTDGKIARHLDRDDMVSNTINTFLSLTVQCAQCHNHKFDPISQEDYYRLQAVFAAIDRTNRPFHSSAENAEKFAELTQQKEQWLSRKKEIEAKIARLAGPELARLDQEIAAADNPGTFKPEFGYHSNIESMQGTVKWVQIDLGKEITVDRLVLWGCHDNFNGIGAGFGFPIRFKIEVANNPDFKTGVITLEDRTAVDFPNPGIAPVTIKPRGITGRFVRLTATKLSPRENDFILALAEMEVYDSGNTNRARNAPIMALDSIEAPPRWRKSNLTDGIAAGKESSGKMEELLSKRSKLIASFAGSDILVDLQKSKTELARIDSLLAQVKPQGLVYAGGVHQGSGAFRGTGPDGGKPRPIFLLKRGDVTRPLGQMQPGTLSQLPGIPGSLDLPENHGEGTRRAALARWITDPRNPLPWRSIVNRIWQYHFGSAMAASANDFGKMGQPPTHPELLDYLASHFRDDGQSIKQLHRMIVTSFVYRQTSTGDGQREKIDSGNRYLWRMNRRKLEAEAIRDSVLVVAGKWNPALYGPPFQDFVVEHPEHSPHYEYHLANPDNPAYFRRSIYRFLARSKPQPFFTALDCADPSTQVDRRNETLSPLQALALYNDGFMLAMAKHLAARVEKAGSPEDQVSALIRLALGREPTEAERSVLGSYIRNHGLANASRIVLNMNEFVFVD